MFPEERPRRLRQNSSLRSLVRETELQISHLIYPYFVMPGSGIKTEIEAMPGCYRFSIDTLVEDARETFDMGIPAVILFGLPEKKDERGSEAWSPKGVVQKTIAELKRTVPELLVITDVCMCEYTSHGHCGLLKKNKIDNDSTVEMLAKIALSHARAGADLVAPSDMMDGRIGAIREELDENSFEHIAIMSYAVKYSSSFYGPFREAADCAPGFGDRSSYQMDPANKREALKEASLDMQEGADILMVKPAMAYLDIIHILNQEFYLPIAAYQVSGEYSMIKAAAQKGWIDEKRVMAESLISIKRAGADIILTYFAKEYARLKG